MAVAPPNGRSETVTVSRATDDRNKHGDPITLTVSKTSTRAFCVKGACSYDVYPEEGYLKPDQRKGDCVDLVLTRGREGV